MTRSIWWIVVITLAVLAGGAVVWWALRIDSAAGQPQAPGTSASRSAQDLGGATPRAGGSAGSPVATTAPAVAALPATVDPSLGLAATADRLALSLRFDEAGPIIFDERSQQLLGLREVEVDGRTVLAVITQDVLSGQIYTWSSALSFRLRAGQAAADVLLGMGQVRNVFNFGDRVVVDIDPPAVPVVLRRLAQDSRVSDLTLTRIEPRSRPQ